MLKIEPRHLKRWLPIALVLIAAAFGIDLERFAGSGSGNGGSSAPSTTTASGNTAELSGEEPNYRQWSDSNPNINLWHVFEGEINRSGKPVGYHSRPGGDDPAGARVLRVRDGPNSNGVYTAEVEIRDDGQTGTKFSTFFPDSLSRDEVMDAILNAYRKSPNPNAQPFGGPSGLGFTIQGYTSGRGGINTAYPVYTR